MNWSDALALAEKGFDAWAAKPHNRKWFRKIDGTPIKNDLLVNIATAFAEALIAAPANPAPIAELEPVVALIDELRDLTALRYAGDCKCGKCQLVPRATLDKTIGALRQLEAHAAEQVRAERREFTCAARKQSLPEPADCDWPVCGCDPYADKVIAALEESGALKDQSQHPAPIAGLEPVAWRYWWRSKYLTYSLNEPRPDDAEPLYTRAQLEAHAAEQVRPLVEALEGLIEAVELDADEGLEGIGSYTGARLTDAKNAIRARGQV